MAGTGPAPKQPGSRRRRAEPTRGEWRVLSEPPPKRAPAMPRPAPRGGYSARAKAAWKNWWTSPVARAWSEADRDSVEMLMRMVDEFWREPTAAMTAQIRMLKDTLGLTPKGRQDRRWLLPEEAQQAPQLSVIDGGEDKGSNVRRMRAVDADAG